MKVTVIADASVIWGAEKSLGVLLRHMPSDIDVDLVVSPNSAWVQRGEGPLAGWARPGPMARRKTRDQGGIRVAPSSLIGDMVDAVRKGRELGRGLNGTDLVLCFGTWEIPQAIVAARTAGVPCVADLHETFEGRVGLKALEAISSRLAGVLAPAPIGGLHISAPVVVVPRPLETPPSARLGIRRPGSLRLVMVGQIAPTKRALDVVKSLGPSLPRGVSLELVGLSATPSDYEREVVAAARAFPQVAITSRVDDVANVYARSDVVINASAHEAFGRSLVEGMAFGCLPVAMRHSGSESIVAASHGAGSLLENVDDLPQVVEKLAGLPQSELESLRENAWRASERYEPVAVAAEYFGALRMFVEDKR